MRRRRGRRWTAPLAVAAACVAALVGALLAAPALGTGHAAARQPALAPRGGTLAGQSLYSDPAGHAARALARARRGRSDRSAGDAATLRALARPTATWFTGTERAADARTLTRRAQRAGRLPVLVLYDIPDRDCGQHSGGGADDDADYLRWVRGIAAGIGDRPALVVLEPDAVAQALTGCDGLSDPQDRFALLRRATAVLAHGAHTRTYLDAGNAGWVHDAGALSWALGLSGLDDAAGFALNVSNFASTADSVAYGRQLASAAGGARFVVDTSRNGAARVPSSGDQPWCNPPAARLGRAPTTAPHLAGVDALLWIKPPGDSDGACHPGDPAAGTFSLALARRLVG